MVDLDRILGKLDAGERSQLGAFAQMINDPLSRNILAKLASPHTPMCLSDLPLKELQAKDSVSVMSRLHKFEQLKLVESKMVKHESGAYRTFEVTSQGRTIVDKYMKQEQAFFA